MKEISAVIVGAFVGIIIGYYTVSAATVNTVLERITQIIHANIPARETQYSDVFFTVEGRLFDEPEKYLRGIASLSTDGTTLTLKRARFEDTFELHVSEDTLVYTLSAAYDTEGIIVSRDRGTADLGLLAQPTPVVVYYESTQERLTAVAIFI